MIVVIIIGKIILYALLVLLILLLTFLAIPFKYYISCDKHDELVAKGYVSWLFGGIRAKFDYSTENGFVNKFTLFGKSIRPGSKKNGKQANKKRNDKSKSKKEKTKEKPAYSYFSFEIFKQVITSVFKILNHYRPKKLMADAVIGFEDPMYTGLLCGLKEIGSTFLHKYNINLQMNFEDEVLEGSFIIGGSIQLFYLILVGIEFVLTKPFRKTLFNNIKFKIKRRLKRWRIVSVLVKT